MDKIVCTASIEELIYIFEQVLLFDKSDLIIFQNISPEGEYIFACVWTIIQSIYFKWQETLSFQFILDLRK